MSDKKKSYLDTLNEVFDGSGTPSQEQVLGLMDETMSFFQKIKEQLQSGDPEAQKKAFQETIQMKELLERQMAALAEKTGFDFKTLFAENAGNMSSEERNTFEVAQARLQGLKTDQTSQQNPFNNKSKIIG